MDKVLKMADSLFGADSPKYAIAKDVATECQDGKDADRCEASHNIYACSMESIKKHGIDLKELM